MNDLQKEITADVSKAWQKIDELVGGFYELLPNLLIALVVFVLFFSVAKLVQYSAKKWTKDRKSHNLGIVLGRLGKWIVVLFGLMVAVSIVSPSIGASEFFGTLGIGSVAFGFAFKDILQNFLAGILILLREPFEIGDSIIFGNYEGTVEAIETRSTLLRTFDGQRVIIPNGSIYTNSVEVVSAFPHRRKHAVIGIGYDDNIPKARERAIKAMMSVDGVLSDPAPVVTVEELAASSVNLKAFWWCENDRYMEVYTNVFVAIKEAFDMDNIEMPYSKVELVNKGVQVKLSNKTDSN